MHPDVAGYGEVHKGEVYHESAFFDPKVTFANSGVVEPISDENLAAAESQSSTDGVELEEVKQVNSIEAKLLSAVHVVSAPEVVAIDEEDGPVEVDPGDDTPVEVEPVFTSSDLSNAPVGPSVDVESEPKTTKSITFE